MKTDYGIIAGGSLRVTTDSRYHWPVLKVVSKMWGAHRLSWR